MRSSTGITDNVGPCIAAGTLIVSLGPLLTPNYLFWFVFLVSLFIAAMEAYSRYTHRHTTRFQPYGNHNSKKTTEKKTISNKSNSSSSRSGVKAEHHLSVDNMKLRKAAEKQIHRNRRLSSDVFVDEQGGFYSGRFAKIVNKVRRHRDRRSCESPDGRLAVAAEGAPRKCRSMINLAPQTNTSASMVNSPKSKTASSVRPLSMVNVPKIKTTSSASSARARSQYFETNRKEVLIWRSDREQVDTEASVEYNSLCSLCQRSATLYSMEISMGTLRRIEIHADAWMIIHMEYVSNNMWGIFF